MKGRLQNAGGLGGGLNAPAAAPASELKKLESLSGSGKAAFYEDSLGNTQVAASVQNIGQKTFYRRQNQWRDSSVTPEQEKQARRVKQFSPEYFELATKHGSHLSKYLVFTEPVLVNLGDVTYQIDPPDPEGT